MLYGNTLIFSFICLYFLSLEYFLHSEIREMFTCNLDFVFIVTGLFLLLLSPQNAF